MGRQAAPAVVHGQLRQPQRKRTPRTTPPPEPRPAAHAQHRRHGGGCDDPTTTPPPPPPPLPGRPPTSSEIRAQELRGSAARGAGRPRRSIRSGISRRAPRERAVADIQRVYRGYRGRRDARAVRSRGLHPRTGTTYARPLRTADTEADILGLQGGDGIGSLVATLRKIVARRDDLGSIVAAGGIDLVAKAMVQHSRDANVKLLGMQALRAMMRQRPPRVMNFSGCDYEAVPQRLPATVRHRPSLAAASSVSRVDPPTEKTVCRTSVAPGTIIHRAVNAEKTRETVWPVAEGAALAAAAEAGVESAAAVHSTPAILGTLQSLQAAVEQLQCDLAASAAHNAALQTKFDAATQGSSTAPQQEALIGQRLAAHASTMRSSEDAADSDMAEPTTPSQHLEEVVDGRSLGSPSSRPAVGPMLDLRAAASEPSAESAATREQQYDDYRALLQVASPYRSPGRRNLQDDRLRAAPDPIVTIATRSSRNGGEMAVPHQRHLAKTLEFKHRGLNMEQTLASMEAAVAQAAHVVTELSVEDDENVLAIADTAVYNVEESVSTLSRRQLLRGNPHHTLQGAGAKPDNQPRNQVGSANRPRVTGSGKGHGAVPNPAAQKRHRKSKLSTAGKRAARTRSDGLVAEELAAQCNERLFEGLATTQPWMECWGINSENKLHRRDSAGHKLVKRLANHLRTSTSVPFVDTYFPATEASVRKLSSLPSSAESIQRRKQHVRWLRPAEFVPAGSHPVVFGSSLDWQRIQQRSADNCFLLVALQFCASAGNTWLLDDLIVSDGADVGLYGVKLYVHGQWVTVLVDDQFPCTLDADSGLWVPIGSECQSITYKHEVEMELWVLIVEKALAKLHGGYGATEHLQPRRTEDTLNYLTAGPVSVIDFRTDHNCWDHLIAVSAEVVPVGCRWVPLPSFCLTCSVDRGKESRAVAQRACERGLVLGRVYRVCAAVELPPRGNSGPPRRLIQLCDPFEKAQWKGDWRTDDRRWTPQLKHAAGLDCAQADEASFFVSLVDFA
eukprot:COSAG01_NODE_1109_length_11660_cov_40.459822_5_plen_1015_part_00